MRRGVLEGERGAGGRGGKPEGWGGWGSRGKPGGVQVQMGNDYLSR